MPRGKVTHDTGGTREGLNACFAAIRKVISSRGKCTEVEARGMAMGLFPEQVLIRVGAQKLKNRKRGTSCRFAEEIDAFMSGRSVSAAAAEWFRIVGGNRQLTRIKQAVQDGRCDGVRYDRSTKEFLPA